MARCPGHLYIPAPHGVENEPYQPEFFIFPHPGQALIQPIHGNTARFITEDFLYELWLLNISALESKDLSSYPLQKLSKPVFL